jgi:hypothetical protein
MGLAFAIIASLALSCLHECVRALEDPFVGHVTLDGIDVCEELNYLHYENLINTREVAFPDAPDVHADTLDDDTQSVRKAERVVSSRFCRNSSVVTRVIQSTTFPRSLLSAQDIYTEPNGDQAVEKVSRNELLCRQPSSTNCSAMSLDEVFVDSEEYANRDISIELPDSDQNGETRQSYPDLRSRLEAKV